MLKKCYTSNKKIMKALKASYKLVFELSAASYSEELAHVYSCTFTSLILFQK